MSNLVPHFILEKHAAGERQGRFSAVSLFVDISGFSAVTNTLMEHGSEAAEAMANVMCGVFEPLVEAVYAQGGWITTFAGDAFTALFEANAEGPQQQRALAAALAIQQHMIAHPVQETLYGSFPFSIKLGLGAGQVDWGILASEQAEGQAAYYFSGPAIEAAAGAEHYAQPGNLILSPSIQESLADRIKTLPAGDEGHTRLLTVEGDLPAPLPLAEPELWPGQAAFVPPAVLERPGQGEFRPVVSVFVNLMGVESGADLVTFMEAVFELRRQYGGYLARVDFGDKGCNLLLFWGMPKSTEDDIACALGFACDLGDHTPGTYKAGLTYRPMYAGLAGSERRAEYTAYGGGVSYAARLMVAAPWGGIWLDERVANRARGHYLIEREGEHSFKGFDQPQPVYTLVERQALDIAGFYQGEMVGRQAELAQLETFVQPLLAPQGESDPAGRSRFAGVLVVEGEAGLGKSRLVHEFLARLTQALTSPLSPWPNSQAPIPQHFLCQTDQIVRQPLNPFRYWLRSYFGQSPAQSATRNKRAFARKLDQLVATVPDKSLQQALNRGRSFLGALIGLHWPNSPYAQLDPQGRHELTVTALKGLILAESRCRPVILNLEDAHWLDAESVAFVQRLVRQVEGYPLAILATARPTVGDKPLFGQAAYQKVDLAVMQEANLLQLATNLLEGAIGAGLAALLAERAEGNPFFAEQILLYLQEEGGIEQVEGRWQLVGGRAQGSPLPADVRAIFIARLDRLTSEIKDIVQTAAILGREFEVRVLAHMLRDDEALPDKVQSAEEQAIWTVLSQVNYIFKHALLRDAAYEMQLRARRRELHRLAAVALESLYEDHLAEHYGQLAYHYEAAYRQGLAQVQAQAGTYLRQAGEQAAADYENESAVDYYSRALALTPESDDQARFELLLGREAVYGLQGQREAQASDLETLEVLAQSRQRPAEQAEVALRWAAYANDTGDYPQAIEKARAAAAYAQAAGDVGREAAGQLAWAEALRVQGEYAAMEEHTNQALSLAVAAGQRDLEATSLRSLGNVAFYQGDRTRAWDYWGQALALYREIGHRLGESRALNNLGVIADEQGDHARAQGYYEQSLATSREIGYRAGEGIALGNLGIIADNQGNYAGAQGYHEQALAIYREIGDRQGESLMLNNLGVAVGRRGNHARAQGYSEQALAIDREIGNRQGEATATHSLGIVAFCCGDYARARDYCEQALAISREIGYRRGEGIFLTSLGDALIMLGRLDKAVAFLQQAISLWRELDDIVPQMETRATLARAYLAQGDTDQALAAVEEVLAYLGGGGSFDGSELLLRNHLACYQVLHATDDPRAAGVLQAAYNQLQEQAGRIPDEPPRRSFLENVPWHREILAAYRGEEVETIPAPTPAGETAADEAAVVVPQVAAEAAPVEAGVAAPSAPSVPETTAAAQAEVAAAEPGPEMEPVGKAAVESASMAEAVGPSAAVRKPQVVPDAAAIGQIAELLAAAAEMEGALFVNLGTINIHFHGSPGLSVGQDTAGTAPRRARRGKRGKKKRKKRGGKQTRPK